MRVFTLHFLAIAQTNTLHFTNRTLHRAPITPIFKRQYVSQLKSGIVRSIQEMNEDRRKLSSCNSQDTLLTLPVTGEGLEEFVQEYANLATFNLVNGCPLPVLKNSTILDSRDSNHSSIYKLNDTLVVESADTNHKGPPTVMRGERECGLKNDFNQQLDSNQYVQICEDTASAEENTMAQGSEEDVDRPLSKILEDDVPDQVQSRTQSSRNDAYYLKVGVPDYPADAPHATFDISKVNYIPIFLG